MIFLSLRLCFFRVLFFFQFFQSFFNFFSRGSLRFLEFVICLNGSIPDRYRKRETRETKTLERILLRSVL